MSAYSCTIQLPNGTTERYRSLGISWPFSSIDSATGELNLPECPQVGDEITFDEAIGAKCIIKARDFAFPRVTELAVFGFEIEVRGPDVAIDALIELLTVSHIWD